MSRYANIDERRRDDGSVIYRLRIKRRDVPIAEEFTSEAAALARRAEVLDALRSGSDPPPPPAPEAVVEIGDRPATVHDVARRLVRGIESGQIRTRDGAIYKPSMVRGYERELRRHVLPEIGALPIRELSRRDAQRLVDRIAITATPEIARKALVALRVVCRLALADDLIETNPCHGVRAKIQAVREERPPRILEPEETARILRAAALDDERMQRSLIYPMARLAVDAGLRSGEILALHWGRDGVDLAAGSLRIRASMDRERGRDRQFARVATKSVAGRREIHIGPGLAAVLRTHRERTGRADGDPLFADERGKPLVPQGKPRASWLRALRSAEIADPQPRFHDLRHAYATHLLAAGLSAHAVANLLGHADAGLVWRRYGHALPSEIATAADRLEAFRERAGGRP